MTKLFYAFALNEFKFRCLTFTVHKTKEAAEKSAYKLSGQASRARRRDFIGTESATDDLTPQVIAGKAALEAWAKECSYKIDWNDRLLLFQEEKRR